MEHSEANDLAYDAYMLYQKLVTHVGPGRAWEFVLSYYQGAAKE